MKHSLSEICSADPTCLTCGDVAVEMVVIDVSGPDASCRDERGQQEIVATELVDDLKPGDRVLVHAGVAIKRLEG